MADNSAGRHRSTRRYNPVSEMATVVARAGGAGMKGTAVVAAAGGLVAAVAVPANAAPALGAQAPEQAPLAATAAPSVVAPRASSPVAQATFGVSGVKAVAKPKPKPPPVVTAGVAIRTRATTATSRSTTRTAAATAPAPAAPAPTRVVASGSILDIARSLLGIPYVYGGSTSAGFDCSGFTQYVYGRAGISLPRTAEGQRQAARRTSSPQPGDLVFFGSPAYHVGIYVAPGVMIDSPHTGTVTQQRAIYSGASYGTFR